MSWAKVFLNILLARTRIAPFETWIAKSFAEKSFALLMIAALVPIITGATTAVMTGLPEKTVIGMTAITETTEATGTTAATEMTAAPGMIVATVGTAQDRLVVITMIDDGPRLQGKIMMIGGQQGTKKDATRRMTGTTTDPQDRRTVMEDGLVEDL